MAMVVIKVMAMVKLMAIAMMMKVVLFDRVNNVDDGEVIMMTVVMIIILIVISMAGILMDSPSCRFELRTQEAAQLKMDLDKANETIAAAEALVNKLDGEFSRWSGQVNNCLFDGLIVFVLFFFMRLVVVFFFKSFHSLLFVCLFIEVLST